ncbi:MAG: Xaa-Pro peptidase family protein [Actinomycetota bacterium]
MTTIDQVALRTSRKDRLRAQMAARDIAAVILFDPVNIRYATGTRNMQVFTSRNPARYVWLPVEGDTILFEFTGAEHLGVGIETVDEVRTATTASFVAAGPAIEAVERRWAAEMAALIRERVGGDARVGLERVNAGAAIALAAQGITLVDAQEPVERARAIKGAEELLCIAESLRATEAAMHAMRDAIEPGLTENQLWSIFHQHVIAEGADYIETRLLKSGPAANPGFAETSDKVIEEDELIAFDTDVVGCHGYYSDFSRTFHVGPHQPSAVQREMYAISHEQVHHNMGIVQPGMTFEEYSHKAWTLPEKYSAHRYYLSAHGVGMTGEYPYLYHAQDFPDAGYDGVIEPGMTLCVESFLGAEDGGEGVKLEEQILVTDTGTELLSQFPFEDALLA